MGTLSQKTSTLMSPCVVCSVTDIIAVPRRVSRPRASPRFGGEGRKGKLGRQVRRSFGRGLGGNALFLATDLTTGAEDLGGVGVLQGWAVSTDAARSRPTCVRYRGFKVAKVVCTSAGWECEEPESSQAVFRPGGSRRISCLGIVSSSADDTWCRRTAWRGPGPKRVLPDPHCHPRPSRD